MNTRGRKLFRYVAGFMTAAVLMGAAYTTTAMASGIGLISTEDLLDIYADASTDSEVVGQVMDEGRVAILGRSDGWVQIQAGNIVGWVPESNLIETDDSNEEAVEANEELITELAEQIIETQESAESISEEDALAQENNTAEENGPETAQEAQAAETAALPHMAAETDTPAETGAQMQENAPAEQSAGTAGESRELTEEEKAALEAYVEAQALLEEQIRQQQAMLDAAIAEAAKQAEEQAAALVQQEEAAKRAEAEAAMQVKQAEEQAAKAQQEEADKQAAAEAAQKETPEPAADMTEQETLNETGVTEDELYLLANIIYCEAGSEPYIGKVAVGSVVMNRVASDKSPNTIKEVIYAKNQFSPVGNGSLAKALRNNSADESCYRAALEALRGSKPVGNKLFFRRVNGRSGQVIGHHVFY